MILEGYLKSVYLLLAIALVSILIFKFEFSFGEERPIPDWVKTTISLWSNGSITNDEFVRAIEYLSDRGIITISSVDEKESQKQIEYLKAKSEVFENEVKQLREENKEYRIQIQSQKIIKSNDYPSTMSNLLDEYQTLQNEIKSLRETNKQFSKQIDSWMMNNESIENKLSSNIKNEQILKMESDYNNKINLLKLENSQFATKIKELEDQTKLYQKNVDLLKTENQNKQDMIDSLNTINHENKSNVNQLIKNEEEYKSIIINLENENLLQKQKINEYEYTIINLEKNSADLNDKIIQANNEFTQNQEKISFLEQENYEQRQILIGIMNEAQNSAESNSLLDSKLSQYQQIIEKLENKNYHNQQRISNLENENIEKNNSLILINKEVEILNDQIIKLNSKIQKYENSIKLLENENMIYKNDLISIDKKTLEFESKINKLEEEKITQSEGVVKLLAEKNTSYEKTIDELKMENKLLEKKLSAINNSNAENLILMSETFAENKVMKEQIDVLIHEIEEKHEQIISLEKNQKQNNFSNILDSSQNTPTFKIDSDLINDLSRKNDLLLVELNYLKAKNLVNDEEIELLRGENQEYRVLLNLLKKGQHSVTGIESANYGAIDNEGQGVVILPSTQTQKRLPDDWISQIKVGSVHTIFVENSPNWSQDMSDEVDYALTYWKETANVDFKIVNDKSVSMSTITWKKDLPNGYDGYALNQSTITIGLGNTYCDGKWRPYSSESVRNILIHELGHILGLGHSIDKSNIMYPMINDAKFAPIEKTFVISGDDSEFIRGCSFSVDPSYNYYVSVQDSNKVDVFFVPSIDEKQNVEDGKSFDYYSNMECIAIEKSYKSGVCKIADSGGMLLINSNKNPITVKVYLEEK